MTQTPPTMPQPGVARKPPMSGLALASMIMGVVGAGSLCGVLCCVPTWLIAPVASPGAVVLGHWALVRIRRGKESGEGMALAGLILGYLVLGLIAALLVLAAFGVWVDQLEQYGVLP